MGMYAVQTADTADLAAMRAAASDGRTAAILRRRAVASGQSALGLAAENLHVGAESAMAPVALNGHGVPSGAGVVTDGVAAAYLGRALSMDRRRRVSQGKRALNGGAGQASAAAAVKALPAAEDVEEVDGAGVSPVASNGQGVPSGAPGVLSGAGVVTDGVAAAYLGRALSMDRRRRVSQGKRALNGGAGQASAAAGETSAAAAVGAPTAAESTPVDMATRRQQARAEVSRLGRAAIRRPQSEGRVAVPPKVIASPTHGGQGVTGLRIGPGVRVTGDEAGAALPVSGTQYVAADGPPPAPGAGRKVGLARTPQGLTVSGTTVRNNVAITGDEFGEHLPITGEADQKLADDLTPRRDGTYVSVQFPRRADPHGASAVGTRLGTQAGVANPGGDGVWLPLETTDRGWSVSGTAVGRSGRVTGNEAGACRPITGDQYQRTYSTECGGTGGGTAPAAHLNRARLDPATLGKVTVAQTWAGQRVTGPSVEHRPNVTGDEPGSCSPVTGTPYHGPSTAFGWCEPDEGESGAQRLDSRPGGVAVTGNVPMHAKAVTGTERGGRHAVTGTPYYRDMRPAEPAADDWAGGAFPVAQARRLAGRVSDGPQEADATPPASNVPGRITGSFAVGGGKVTGNKEFLFQARPSRDGRQKHTVVTGEGRTEGTTVTGSAWTAHDRVTGTEGYIAAGRNPSEGGGGTHGWAGTRKFADLATPGGPADQNVTGLSGWTLKPGTRITVSGGAQG